MNPAERKRHKHYDLLREILPRPLISFNLIKKRSFLRNDNRIIQRFKQLARPSLNRLNNEKRKTYYGTHRVATANLKHLSTKKCI